jgi:hypothetical protein
MMTGHMVLPPKTAEQFADRARRGEGLRLSPDSSIYEFAQGSNVVCLISLDPPIGHIGKDARRANEIRAALSTQGAS